jgi:Protein of unknown function (DUF1569)
MASKRRHIGERLAWFVVLALTKKSFQKEIPVPVNTAKVEGRRKVEYASFDELLADAERLGSGPVRALGNWSAGQIFRHLAIVYTGSIDGLKVKFPWYLRLMAKLFKKQVLAGAMPAGFKLPADSGKEMMPGPTSTQEGLADLRAAVARLKQEPHRAAHPAFGNFTKEEWDVLHLKHAALHMSFLVPE